MRTRSVKMPNSQAYQKKVDCIDCKCNHIGGWWLVAGLIHTKSKGRNKNIYLLFHNSNRKIGNCLKVQQTDTDQHMVFIFACGFILYKVKRVAAHCDDGCSILSKIFGDSTDGR